MTQRHLLVGALGAVLFVGGCQSARSTAQAPRAGSVDASGSATPAGPSTGAPSASAAGAGATGAGAAGTFGGPQKLSAADAVPASAVLADPAAYRDRYVRLTGKVSDVCPKKGCWLRVTPADARAGAEDIFIKFPDPPTGVLVPREAVGKDVTVEGTVKLGTISEKMARHFKEDAGAPQAEIERIVGPQKQVMISGPRVAIAGVTPPAPSAPPTPPAAAGQ